MTPSNGASGDNLTCAMLVPSAIRVISISSEQRSEYANVSAVHDAFTSIPPLARRPRKLPSFQSSGSAGRSRINPSWLCRSISDNAAGKPRLPSIWNGGCAHRPLSYTPPPSRSVSASVSTGRRNMPMMRSACSYAPQAGPHDHAPDDAPARTVVATYFKGFPRGLLQTWGLRCDAYPWI